MADLPLDLLHETLAPRVLETLDVEGKIARAFEALGPIADRDVVLADGGRGYRARQLAKLGGRVTVVGSPAEIGAIEATGGGTMPRVGVAQGSLERLGLPDASADVLVSCWSGFRGPSPKELAEANRVLRPAGRLLVLHDYGRDDTAPLRPGDQTDVFTWSRRDGWFLQNGFKIRVIHCWWTFASTDEARELLGGLFGEPGERIGGELRRPRLSYNVAIYHRDRNGSAPTEGR